MTKNVKVVLVTLFFVAGIGSAVFQFQNTTAIEEKPMPVGNGGSIKDGLFCGASLNADCNQCDGIDKPSWEIKAEGGEPYCSIIGTERGFPVSCPASTDKNESGCSDTTTQIINIGLLAVVLPVVFSSIILQIPTKHKD